jgi:ABC-2 type transport system permease protein
MGHDDLDWSCLRTGKDFLLQVQCINKICEMMPVALRIAQMELRLAWRKTSSKAIFAVFAFLLVTALCLGHQRQREQHQQQAHYQHLIRTEWLEQPDRHPHRVAHFGNFAFKPKSLLASFDPGVEAHVGRIQFLEAHRQNPLNFAEASGLTSASRFGELSPSLVAGPLLALVIVILGHAMVSEEYESGRFRLLLAQGVSKRNLWWGKVAGLSLIVLPFVLLVPCGQCAMTLYSNPSLLEASGGDPLPDFFVRGMLLLFALMLHSLLWILLAVFASTLAPSRSQATAVLLCLWASTAILIPRLSGAIASEAHPLPTRSAFMDALEAALEKLGDSHNDSDPIFQKLREETLRLYGVTAVEALPVNYRAIVMAKSEQNSSEVYQSHSRELEGRMRRQESLIGAWAWLSPTLCWQEISMRLCGTDAGAARVFCEQAERWRYEFVQKLNALQREHIRYEHNSTQRLDRSHWQGFEEFSPEAPNLSESLKGALPAVVRILLLSALLAVAGVVVAERSTLP